MDRRSSNPRRVAPASVVRLAALVGLLALARCGSGAAGFGPGDAAFVETPRASVDARTYRAWDTAPFGANAGAGARDAQAVGEVAGAPGDGAAADARAPGDAGGPPDTTAHRDVAAFDLPPADLREFVPDPVAFGPGTENPFVLGPETASGLSLDEDGNLVLASQEELLRFIWIANSGENTVSRLDTETGAEVGRYRVCVDPSRTAVDRNGDVWVGCRGDGAVAKIAHDARRCPDRDDDGVIRTSADRDGDGAISGDELLPAGADECVLFVVTPFEPDAIARAVAVDADNHAWVGFWRTGMLARLDPYDGSVVQQIPTNGSPYGLAIDRQGILWVSFRSSGGAIGDALGRVDPSNPGVVQTESPSGCLSPYGVAIDRFGRLWLGNWDCRDLLVFQPAGTNPGWRRIPLGDVANTRGVAASMDGFVCAGLSDGACGASRNRYVACVSDTDFSVRTFDLDPGGSGTPGPVGVAFAADGMLWAVNQCGSSATRVDPFSGAILGTYPVGAAPYTYSDMTGYALQAQVDPEGWYQIELTTDDPKFRQWQWLHVDAAVPAGAALYVRLRSYRDSEAQDGEGWSPRFGPFPPATFPFDLTTPDVEPYTQWGTLSARLLVVRDGQGPSPVVRGITAYWR